jgi:uncharacterized membrane protein YhaH (DUF805 family)
MTTDPNIPAAPQPGSIQDIWEVCWSNLTTKYAEFTGRAGRREFWTFWLTVHIALLAAAIFAQIPYLGILIGICLILAGLATFIPSLAVGARRLHDIGQSGWWQVLLIIPIFGLIPLVIMWAQPSKSEPQTIQGHVVS